MEILKMGISSPANHKRRPLPYLDALLELVSGCGRSFPEQLTEDDDLLKQKDSTFFGAWQDAGVLLRHKEGFLLQQFSLTGQFTLQKSHTGQHLIQVSHDNFGAKHRFSLVLTSKLLFHNKEVEGIL